ncbi:hypothetical protein H5410_024833 [Solanum commersonii]|uniref:Uncharacterized protein n=1 Tax=Solanum commersonii TaxID=4109 RepID=A0A9J5ZN31_SOLCO|nr:hypothetical protein H5410_024833 [Solanum commersonii]
MEAQAEEITASFIRGITYTVTFSGSGLLFGNPVMPCGVVLTFVCLILIMFVLAIALFFIVMVIKTGRLNPMLNDFNVRSLNIIEGARESLEVESNRDPNNLEDPNLAHPTASHQSVQDPIRCGCVRAALDAAQVALTHLSVGTPVEQPSASRGSKCCNSRDFGRGGGNLSEFELRTKVQYRLLRTRILVLFDMANRKGHARKDPLQLCRENLFRRSTEIDGQVIWLEKWTPDFKPEEDSPICSSLGSLIRAAIPLSLMELC